MRCDENGDPCPETLGEYRELCVALGVPNNEATAFLDYKIAISPKGEDEVVLAQDSQMRFLLFPMLLKTVGED